MTVERATRVQDEDAYWDDGGPGVYRSTDIEGTLCWFMHCPGGCGNHLLLGPKPPGAGHVVEELEDGSITVRPNPPSDVGNSNSIKCPKCGWHGYIERDVLREV